MPDIFRVVMVPADGEDFSLRNPSDEIPYQRHDPQMDIRDEHKSRSLLEEVKKHRHKTPMDKHKRKSTKPALSQFCAGKKHANPDGNKIIILIFENMSFPLPC